MFAQAISSAMIRARSDEVVPAARASSVKRTLISAMRYAASFAWDVNSFCVSPSKAAAASTSAATSSKVRAATT